MTEKKEDKEAGQTVVERALLRFTKAVGEQEGLAPVATRLNATLLDKGDLSEAALRAALFGDATT